MVNAASVLQSESCWVLFEREKLPREGGVQLQVGWLITLHHNNIKESWILNKQTKSKEKSLPKEKRFRTQCLAELTTTVNSDELQNSSQGRADLPEPGLLVVGEGKDLPKGQASLARGPRILAGAKSYTSHPAEVNNFGIPSRESNPACAAVWVRPVGRELTPALAGRCLSLLSCFMWVVAVVW